MRDAFQSARENFFSSAFYFWVILSLSSTKTTRENSLEFNKYLSWGHDTRLKRKRSKNIESVESRWKKIERGYRTIQITIGYFKRRKKLELKTIMKKCGLQEDYSNNGFNTAEKTLLQGAQIPF